MFVGKNWWHSTGCRKTGTYVGLMQQCHSIYFNPSTLTSGRTLTSNCHVEQFPSEWGPVCIFITLWPKRGTQRLCREQKKRWKKNYLEWIMKCSCKNTTRAVRITAKYNLHESADLFMCVYNSNFFLFCLFICIFHRYGWSRYYTLLINYVDSIHYM